MDLLVTGATGFTGGKLARHLSSQGHRVRTLARPSPRADALQEAGIEVVEGNIADKADVDKAVDGVEQVYHIAACYRTAGHPDDYYRQVNVGGTEHVLAAARRAGCERLVHCSTVGVHGSVPVTPADENAPFSPGDIYQVTKLEGEKKARAAQEDGQPVAIFRPAPIYGPGDLRLLKLFRTVKNGTFRMFGAGTVNYHLVYIDDLVRGIELCGTQAAALGGCFILCGPRYTPLNELVRRVAEAVGVDPPRGRLPLKPLMAAAVVCENMCRPFGIDPPLHKRRAEFFIKNRAFTCAKAQREIGCEPQGEREDVAKRTAQWYKEAGHL